MKTKKSKKIERVNSVQLSISLPTEIASYLNSKRDEGNGNVSEQIKEAIKATMERDSLVDMRDIRILMERAETVAEFKELLNTTIITGQIDWDDELPPINLTPILRAAYLRKQVERRLKKLRNIDNARPSIQMP